jgi:hypothetical protein
VTETMPISDARFVAVDEECKWPSISLIVKYQPFKPRRIARRVSYDQRTNAECVKIVLKYLGVCSWVRNKITNRNKHMV